MDNLHLAWACFGAANVLLAVLNWRSATENEKYRVKLNRYRALLEAHAERLQVLAKRGVELTRQLEK